MAGAPVGKNPLSPRTAWWRIGPRRQGFASPLRALDCSGADPRGDAVHEGKGGGRAVGRGEGNLPEWSKKSMARAGIEEMELDESNPPRDDFVWWSYHVSGENPAAWQAFAKDLLDGAMAVKAKVHPFDNAMHSLARVEAMLLGMALGVPAEGDIHQAAIEFGRTLLKSMRSSRTVNTSA